MVATEQQVCSKWPTANRQSPIANRSIANRSIVNSSVNAAPVIFRELRAEARRPFNYWLRVIAVAILLLVLATFFFRGGTGLGAGGLMFSKLNATVILAIWLLVPVLTADCISREKREGTLGLLFLTPLRPFSIILAKSCVHMIRALGILLAGLPALAVPILLGGVSGAELIRAASIDFTALALSLAAGLLASTLSRHWVRAITAAFCWNILFSLIFLQLHAILLVGRTVPTSVACRLALAHDANFVAGFAQTSIQYFPLAPGMPLPPGARIITRPGMPPLFTPISPPAAPSTALSFLRQTLKMLGGAVWILVLVLLCAASRLKRSRQDEPLSRRQILIHRLFCTPLFLKARFRNRMSRKLDRNPIGWLQAQSWSGRLTKWGWCLGLLVLQTFMISRSFYYPSIYQFEFYTAVAMLLGIAFAGANSFSQERQNGALELMLVTPLQERQIIFGRLRGLWAQFVPAFGLWVLLWVGMGLQANHEDRLFAPMLLVCNFAAVGMIALDFSLRTNQFMLSWLSSCFVALVCPVIAAAALTMIGAWISLTFSAGWDRGLGSPLAPSNRVLFWEIFLVVQIVFAVCAFKRLHRNLTERSFLLPA